MMEEDFQKGKTRERFKKETRKVNQNDMNSNAQEQSKRLYSQEFSRDYSLTKENR